MASLSSLQNHPVLESHSHHKPNLSSDKDFIQKQTERSFAERVEFKENLFEGESF